MPITREYMKRDMPEDVRAELQEKLDRCMGNDEWANKIFKKVAVLINTYPGHRAYLKSCVETHSKLGYFIALAYDNYIDPKKENVDHELFLPSKDILDKIDLFLMPHHQTWKDVNYPYFWQVKWGASALQQFEYIYCTEGDFVLDKPEGFEQLFSMIGDGDIMTCGPNNDLEISSGAYIVKSKVFLQLVQYMQDHFIPFEKYEQYQEMGGAESRIQAAIKEFGLKRVDMPADPTPDCYHDLKGTWYDLVGLRHIQGELDYAYKFQLIPPHYKYLDEKYLLDVYNYKLVKEYWDEIAELEELEKKGEFACGTHAQSILEEWWKK